MPEASEYGQIDFRKQVIMMTPPTVRSLSMVDWLHSLIYPLDSIMNRDWVFIYGQYVLGHLTGQKMVMQEGLNILFRIHVDPKIIVETVRNEGSTTYVFNETGGEPDITYVWNEGESLPIWVLNEAEATQPLSQDILVKMPSAFASQQNLEKLEQQVEILKPVGTTYKPIVIY